MSGEWRQMRWGSGRDAGLKPHTYNSEEKKRREGKKQAKGKAIGWIATRTWGRVASRWRKGKVFYREW